MTKQEIKEQVEKLGVKVISVTKRNGTYKVRIDWRDYPAVRHLISDTVDFTF